MNWMVLICKNLNSLVKFDWSWPNDSFNLLNVYSIFRYYLPLEKGGSFNEQTWIPWTQECQMGLGFWRRTFYLVNVFHYYLFIRTHLNLLYARMLPRLHSFVGPTLAFCWQFCWFDVDKWRSSDVTLLIGPTKLSTVASMALSPTSPAYVSVMQTILFQVSRWANVGPKWFKGTYL